MLLVRLHPLECLRNPEWRLTVQRALEVNAANGRRQAEPFGESVLHRRRQLLHVVLTRNVINQKTALHPNFKPRLDRRRWGRPSANGRRLSANGRRLSANGRQRSANVRCPREACVFLAGMMHALAGGQGENCAYAK